MTPSPLPPFCALSYSARARKPLREMPVAGSGCGVKLPNSSLPLSIVPLPLRSSTRNASSEASDVHASCSFSPSLSKSKLTPPSVSVSRKPFPRTSISIGDLSIIPSQVQVEKFISVHHTTHQALQLPPPPSGVGVGFGVAVGEGDGEGDGDGDGDGDGEGDGDGDGEGDGDGDGVGVPGAPCTANSVGMVAVPIVTGGVGVTASIR